MRARGGLVPLAWAELISTTGSAMTGLALPWLVLTQTESPSTAGLVVAAEVIPMVVVGIPSGSIVSRMGPRRTMMICDLARAPATAALPILLWLDTLPLGAVLVLAAWIGAFFPAHMGAQRTIVPELVGEASGQVARAYTLLQAANRLPVVAGPVLAGVLIAQLGAPVVLLIDAASYVVSVLLLAFVTPVPGLRESGKLLAGAALLAHDRTLATLTLTTASLELASQAVFLSLPILAYTVYDENVAVGSTLLACWGAGTLVGLPIAGLLAKRDPIRVLRVGFIAQGLPLWALAQDLPVGCLAAALLISGAASSNVNPPALTFVSSRAAGPLLAKVNLAFLTVVLGAGGIGVLVTGLLAQALGVRAAMAIVAALATAFALAFLLSTGPRNRHSSPQRLPRAGRT